MLAHFGLYFCITPEMSSFQVLLHLSTEVEIITWKYSAVLWASKTFLLVCVDLVNSIYAQGTVLQFMEEGMQTAVAQRCYT
jgi:hypothetical protein